MDCDIGIIINVTINVCLKLTLYEPRGLYSAFFDQNNKKLIKILINTVDRGKWCTDGAVLSFFSPLCAQRDDVIYA